MPGYTYKIKKRAKEVGDTLVEKHGLCAEFTLRDLNREINDATRQHNEYEANAKVNKTIMDNVIKNNAWLEALVSGLTAQKLHAAQMYFNAKAKHGMYATLAKQSKKALATLKKEDSQVRALVTKK